MNSSNFLRVGITALFLTFGMTACAGQTETTKTAVVTATVTPTPIYSQACSPGTPTPCSDGTSDIQPTSVDMNNLIVASMWDNTLGSYYGHKINDVVLGNGWTLYYLCDSAHDKFVDIHIENLDTFDTVNLVMPCSQDGNFSLHGLTGFGPVNNELPAGHYRFDMTAIGSWYILVSNP